MTPPLTHAYALGKCYLVERVDVTDEMVERAARYCDQQTNGSRAGNEAALNHWRERMRGALAAAFTTGEENER